jgi:2-polyprenyl-6-methoxyphenol hydroxylase-like FAD-dependent oxidoreductase
MMRRVDTQVLVVGGGPVGLSLAMDLAWAQLGHDDCDAAILVRRRA